MTTTLKGNQISIFFQIQAKSVQNLIEIMNKSQPALYNTANKIYGSRKEPQMQYFGKEFQQFNGKSKIFWSAFFLNKF